MLIRRAAGAEDSGKAGEVDIPGQDTEAVDPTMVGAPGGSERVGEADTPAEVGEVVLIRRAVGAEDSEKVGEVDIPAAVGEVDTPGDTGEADVPVGAAGAYSEESSLILTFCLGNAG